MPEEHQTVSPERTISLIVLLNKVLHPGREEVEWIRLRVAHDLLHLEGKLNVAVVLDIVIFNEVLVLHTFSGIVELLKVCRNVQLMIHSLFQHNDSVGFNVSSDDFGTIVEDKDLVNSAIWIQLWVALRSGLAPCDDGEEGPGGHFTQSIFHSEEVHLIQPCIDTLAVLRI